MSLWTPQGQTDIVYRFMTILNSFFFCFLTNSPKFSYQLEKSRSEIAVQNSKSTTKFLWAIALGMSFKDSS